MENKKIENSKSKNVSKNKRYIQAIGDNVSAYVKANKTSIPDLAEKADIPRETLNNLVYRDMSDCKLGTVIAIARAMGITIEELISADIWESETYKNLQICRKLPQHKVSLIRWFIKHQEVLEKQSVNGKRYISVQNTKATNDKVIKVTNNFKMIDISECGLSKDVFNKTFFALKLNCQCYFPIYSGDDIILLANDRNPLPHEHGVVCVGDSLFIVECRYNSDSLLEFYNIRDGKYRTNIDRIDEFIGYITTVVPDTSIEGNL